MPSRAGRGRPSHGAAATLASDAGRCVAHRVLGAAARVMSAHARTARRRRATPAPAPAPLQDRRRRRWPAAARRRRRSPCGSTAPPTRSSIDFKQAAARRRCCSTSTPAACCGGATRRGAADRLADEDDDRAGRRRPRAAEGSRCRITKEALAYRGRASAAARAASGSASTRCSTGCCCRRATTPRSRSPSARRQQRAALRRADERAGRSRWACCARTSRRPSGFIDAGNHSCAVDLAALARAVLASRAWRGSSARRQADPAVPDQGRQALPLQQQPAAARGLPGHDGVKTGYTDAAGRCLVATARRGAGQARRRAAALARPGQAGDAAARPRVSRPASQLNGVGSAVAEPAEVYRRRRLVALACSRSLAPDRRRGGGHGVQPPGRGSPASQAAPKPRSRRRRRRAAARRPRDPARLPGRRLLRRAAGRAARRARHRHAGHGGRAAGEQAKALRAQVAAR